MIVKYMFQKLVLTLIYCTIYVARDLVGGPQDTTQANPHSSVVVGSIALTKVLVEGAIFCMHMVQENTPCPLINQHKGLVCNGQKFIH